MSPDRRAALLGATLLVAGSTARADEPADLVDSRLSLGAIFEQSFYGEDPSLEGQNDLSAYWHRDELDRIDHGHLDAQRHRHPRSYACIFSVA